MMSRSDVAALWQCGGDQIVRDVTELNNVLAFLIAFASAHSLRYVTALRLVAEDRPILLQAATMSLAIMFMMIFGAPTTNFIYFQF